MKGDCGDRPSVNAFHIERISTSYNDDHCYSTTMNMQPRNSESSLPKDVVTSGEVGQTQQQQIIIHSSSRSNAGGGALIGPQERSLPIKHSQELRKTLTLDLNNVEVGKKCLKTPELIQVLRFARNITSPDVEKLSQGFTPTVVTTPTPTRIFNPKDVTAEQESYARGFIDALNQLHQEENGCSTAMLSPVSVVSNNNTVVPLTESNGDYNIKNYEQIDQILKALQQAGLPTPTSSAPLNNLNNNNNSFNEPLPSTIKPLGWVKTNLKTTTTTQPIAVPCLSVNTTTNVKVESISPDCSPRCGSNSSSCSTASSISSSSSTYQSPTSQVSVTNNGGGMNYTSLAPVNFGGILVSGNMLPASADYVTLTSNNNNGHHQMMGNSNHHQIKVEDSANNNNSMHHHGFVTGTNIAPMDPGTQEKLKLERKRARNRLAATKCRKRKIERIETLQEQVNRINNKNEQLEKDMFACRQHIMYLKHLINEHKSKGCDVLIVNNNNNNGKRHMNNGLL